MAQPRDSRGRFASPGWGGPVVAGVVGLILLSGAGPGAGAGTAGLGSSVSPADAAAARSAASRGLSDRSVIRSLKPVIRAGRLVVRVHHVAVSVGPRRRSSRLQVRLEVSNNEPAKIVLHGRDQVLVTYDQRRNSEPEETRAEDVSIALRPGRPAPVTLTFIKRPGDAPALVRLHIGKVTVPVPLRVRAP